MAQPQLQFSAYEQSADSPLVVGITNTGQRIGFEDPNQLMMAAGGKMPTINQVPTMGGFIPFSQYQTIMTPPALTPPAAAPVGPGGTPVAPPPAGGTVPPPTIDPAIERANAAKAANAQAQALYNNIKTNDVKTRESAKVVSSALSAIESNRQSLVQNTAAALAPSPEEQAARQRLAGIQQQSRKLNVQTTAAYQKLDSHNLPDDAIAGFKNELNKDVQLKFQTLGMQEQAAIDSVRMYQEDRNQRIEQAKFLLAENAAEFDRKLGIFDLMRDIESDARQEARADRSEARDILRENKDDTRYEEEKTYNRSQDKKQEMRQQLADIMEFSEGKSWNELDGASQNALREAAKESGLSEQMIRNALGSPNRQWAEENGVTEAFYLSPDGRTVIETKSGDAVDFNEYVRRGGRGDFSDVQKIDANTIQEKKEVSALRLNYWDAGITMKDTLEQAVQKIQTKSKIWAKENKVGSGRGRGNNSNSDSGDEPTVAEVADATKLGWRDEGWLGGNGKIDSGAYKEMKEAWRTEYGFTGKQFDSYMGELIDKDGDNWKQDYGYGL